MGRELSPIQIPRTQPDIVRYRKDYHGIVFNKDETGCSNHIDSGEIRAIAPIDYPDPSAPVPCDRYSKRSTVVACIAADGFRMKLFAIIPAS
jgi:hypothetical protein